jgi:hypothetical protein
MEHVGGLMEGIRLLRPEEGAWLTKVTELHTSLERHIQEEEDDIFLRIGRVWDDSRLEAAGAQMAEMKSKRLGRVA